MNNMKYIIGILLSIIISFIANLIMLEYGIDLYSRSFICGVIGFVIAGIVITIGGE